MKNFKEKANFIWSIADLLRGPYKPADYGNVILPFTVLRRLDVILEPTKKKVLEAYKIHKSKKPETYEPILNSIAKVKFHNHSKFDFTELARDANNITANFHNYLNGYSESAKEIIKHFNLENEIKKLDESDILYLVVKRFQEAGEMFENVSSMEMGYIFEELIRKFAEASNETAGDHFTPREVIKLMVDLLFANDKDALRKKGIVKTIYDPACGTGGMLSVAEEYLLKLNPDAKLEVFGQEWNDQSFAICKSDMLIKGQNPNNIVFGDSFSKDGFENEKFDYILANPPFGVEWKKSEKFVKDEFATKGFGGRFGAVCSYNCCIPAASYTVTPDPGIGDNRDRSPIKRVDSITPYEISSEFAIKPNSDGIINYPNPFKNKTTFQFSIKESTPVTLSIFDMQGNKATDVFINQIYNQGEYAQVFDGSSLSTGTYLAVMTTKNDKKTIKIIKD